MRKDNVLHMNLQYFADGDSGVSDMQALDALLAQADDKGNLIGEPAQTQSVSTQETTPPTTTEPPQTKPTQTQQTQPQNKQEYAFAQMRIQNERLLGALSKVAKATGVQYTSNDELLEKLNDDALTKIAATEKVPVEMLKRLELLETREQQRMQEQLQTSAFVGFQKVKDTFGLTEDELRTFAQELDASGKNPFLTQVNLEAEYKLLHFDEIQDKKIQAAVAAALKTSSAADTHGSVPNSASGKGDEGSDTKISTVAQLDEWLRDK